MEVIKSIIKLKRKSLSRETHKETKLDQFERILSLHPEIDDAAACNILYGNTSKNSEYRVLKHRLEQKLFDDIILTAGEQKYYSNYSFRPLLAKKYDLVAYLLYKNAHTSSAIHVAEKAYEYSRQNYITECAFSISKILINYYGFISPNKKRFELLLRENELLTEILFAEGKALRINAIVSSWYVASKSGLGTEQLVTIYKYVDQLHELKNKYLSNTIFFYYHSIAHFYYNATGQFEKGLNVCNEGILDCRKYFSHDVRFLYRCIVNKAMSHYYLKNDHQSMQEFDKAMSIVPKGHRLWFEDGLIYLIIAARLDRYDLLISLFVERSAHKELNKFPILKEQWLVAEAFIHFLILANEINLSHNNIAVLPKFSVHKFVNNIAFFNKDKCGIHLNVIILKILFYLIKKQYVKIENMTDSLKQYNYSYLKKNEKKRSEIFVKMLNQMVQTGFHPVRAKAHAAKYYDQLTRYTILIDGQSNMVEIIPYEKLWDIILKVLERNLYHRAG